MPKYQIWVLKHVIPYIGLFVALIVAPRQFRARYKEIKNKVYIMELVNDADRLLGLTDQDNLESAIKKAYAQEKFESLWLAEGASFRTHLNYIEKNKGALYQIPASIHAPSMAMVHAGYGLALCKYNLEEHKHGRVGLEDALKTIEASIRENTINEYSAYSFESLGLVTTILHGPKMVSNVDKLLKKNHQSMRELFWHGVGRASYFYPTNFIPTSRSLDKSFKMLNKIATDDVSRRNMAGGVFTAFILVNMKSATVYESLLANSKLIDEWRDVLQNRMEVAPMVRLASSDAVSMIEDLIDHGPQEEKAAKLWKEIIAEPLSRAVTNDGSGVDMNSMFKVPLGIDLKDRKVV